MFDREEQALLAGLLGRMLIHHGSPLRWLPVAAEHQDEPD